MICFHAFFVGLLCLTVPTGFGGPNGLDDPKPEISGTVTSPDGAPLAGVRVDVSTAAPKVGPALFCPSCYLDCRKATTTDDQGKFKLTDLSDKLKFRLVVSAPGRKTLQTKLVDPASADLKLVLQEAPKANQAQTVSGTIKDLLGNPVAGCLISPYGAKNAKRRWSGRVKGVDATVSDSDGRFEIALPESMFALDVNITQFGFCGERRFLLEPGKAPVEITMREGASVSGRLVDNDKPAAGLSIAVVQLERGSNDGIFVKAIGCVTDSEGRFEFQHLPPDQRYCIFSVVGEAKRMSAKEADEATEKRVLTVKKFKVPASGEKRDLGDLQVIEPVSIQGQIKLANNEPLPKDLTLMLDRDPAWDLISIPVGSDGTFEITGLPPETYEIKVKSQDLEIVTKDLNRQLLSPSSIGIFLDKPVTDLIIPVQGK